VNPLAYRPGQQAKAIVAAVIAALSAGVPVCADGHVTLAEGVGVAFAAAVAYGGVFGIRNQPHDSQPAQPG
jgi:hypothetical protein